MSSNVKINVAGSHTQPSRTWIASWPARLVGILVVVLLVGIRAATEFGMMSAHGSDPQMPIWLMFFVVKLAFWAVAGLFAWLPALVWRNRGAQIVAAILLLIWSAAICYASWQFYQASQALSDASDPTTSAARLSQLVHYNGIQAGYELDNRIAANPSTPGEALRELHSKDQLGTEQTLARNPNTPPDILAELADHEEELVQRSLDQNPKLPAAVRQKLKPAPK